MNKLIEQARTLASTSENANELSRMIQKLCDGLEATELKQACNNYIEYLGSNDSNEDSDSDYENDVFERAMEFCIGDDVWDEVNGLIEARDKRE